MKDWNWMQWTAFAILLLLIIGEIVLVFVNPVAAIAGGIGVALGVFVRHLFSKKTSRTETKVL